MGVGEQCCPDCGTYEAAGSYCSACLRRTRPEDKYNGSPSFLEEERRRRGAVVDGPARSPEVRAKRYERIRELRRLRRHR